MGRRLTVTKGTEVDRYAYHASGALTSAQRGTTSGGGNADAVSRVDRLYDGLWRLTREAQAIREGIPRHVDYAYDLAGNRLTLTYPGGVAIQTSYDDLDRANVVKRNGTQIAGCGYVGPRHTSLVLETGTNDVQLTMAYDGASGGRLTRMTYAQTGNTSLPDFSYRYDDAGNLTRKTFEERAGDPSEDYLHDGLDRLTKTTFGQRTLESLRGVHLRRPGQPPHAGQGWCAHRGPVQRRQRADQTRRPRKSQRRALRQTGQPDPRRRGPGLPLRPRQHAHARQRPVGQSN